MREVEGEKGTSLTEIAKYTLFIDIVNDAEGKRIPKVLVETLRGKGINFQIVPSDAYALWDEKSIEYTGINRVNQFLQGKIKEYSA